MSSNNRIIGRVLSVDNFRVFIKRKIYNNWLDAIFDNYWFNYDI